MWTHICLHMFAVALTLKTMRKLIKKKKLPKLLSIIFILFMCAFNLNYFKVQSLKVLCLLALV